jgi:hypothetical protein
MTRSFEPLKSELPIYLMTFGNPLRPLHDLRWYAWTFRPGPPDKEGPLTKELGG